MFFTAMMINAFNPMLENREVIFSGVNVNITANLFTFGVVQGLMAGKITTSAFV